jgi:hypothetical protein
MATSSSQKLIRIPLVNKTGLDMTRYSIYVLGFAAASKKMLSRIASNNTASFTAITKDSGTLPVYKLGTDITEILIDASSPFTPAMGINGARIYFFVSSNTTFPKPPVVTYSGGGAAVQNVPNPPTTAIAPYTFAEFTLIDLAYGAVIDLQTVDGFIFPMNLTLNNGLGSIGQPLGQLTRTSVLAAYKTFMTAQGTTGKPYLDLQFTINSGGLINPGIYLLETDASSQYKNLGSPLNTVFDADLNAFFSNTKLSIQGVQGGSVPADVYTVQSTGPQPLTNNLSHPALQFKGKKTGTVLNVFNPVGMCTMTANGQPITGQLVNKTLTFTQPLPASTVLLKGMYVNGAGAGGTTVVAVNKGPRANTIISVTISAGSGTPPRSQYSFSKIPGVFMTSGAMVFANAGVFALTTGYTADQGVVLSNLQNQIVSAFNRGVANSGPASGADGYSSMYWGTQKNWYPKSTTQNLFSLFMHTGTVPSGKNNIPVFIQAPGSVPCARGTVMGQAYGFAYDENAGPVPPAPVGQPEVPSKYDPLPKDATSLTITLDAW